ncbi:DUF934 domain-containing protein [Gilvimarinus sp. F26214L]|uniref:DUF934 domain-containing protein n=1 Tax=Gilvimarinus sp. DZF01 TaxID=3461371 RepID=UPI004045320B
MPKLIKDGAVARDDWQLIDEETSLENIPSGKVIVPLKLWQDHCEGLRGRLPDLGVWLHGHEETAALADDLTDLPLVAVNFPVFSDGRGFSAGRLLRERHGFRGELRAIGYFLREQLCYLRRCGFSAFSLDDRYDPEDSLSSLEDFTEFYQAAFDEPLPLFRRRAGATA